MRTVHEQEEVGSGCGCCCCGRLLGKELGQLGEVLKEALTASQGASASTKPLPRRVPGNPAPALGWALEKKLQFWGTTPVRVVGNGECCCGGLGWCPAGLGQDERCRRGACSSALRWITQGCALL